MADLQILQQRIERATLRDRHRLRRRLQSLQHAPAGGVDGAREIAKLERELDASIRRCEQRQAAVPAIRYPHELPILDRRDAIQQVLRQHQAVVVAGDTGSGKSTQLPKFCLEMGFGITGMIGHTQPRRIAARSIAARLAAELDVALGREVGFKIRFTDRTRPETHIKLMTDGILLAETQGDRFLEQYDVIILDEAHERSMNVDFLLGYVKRLLPRAPELRLIVTSATIDPQRFAEYLAGPAGPAPIVEVSGRMFPVEVRYRPLVSQDEEDIDLQAAILAAVHELAAIDRGHILVFLPTERDIRDIAKRLRGEKLPGDGVHQTEILPLYGRLSVRDQARVFEHNPYRRIVLATNVAESSLTVPGIQYVIDTGTARISRYAPRSKVQRLPIEAISQASADQRKGRCGRLGPGICIRLYDEQDYLGRPRFTTPEIRRVNLASVILQAMALRLGPVEEFPFPDPPSAESLRDGYRTLFEIGAIDCRQQLTDIGRQLAPLPVDPRIGRIILAAQQENCLAEMLIIAAALETQDPRERPIDKQAAADAAHAAWKDERSDFLGLLKIWDFYHHLKETLSRNKLRRACQENFLSHNRMREWTEIQPPAARPGRLQRHALQAAARRSGERPSGHSRRLPLGCGLPRRRARIHGSRRNPTAVVARLGSVQVQTPMDRRRRIGRDDATLCPHRRTHRLRLGRTHRRSSGQTLVQRSALAREERIGDGLREGDPVRVAAGNAATSPLWADRSRTVQAAVHPTRACGAAVAGNRVILRAQPAHPRAVGHAGGQDPQPAARAGRLCRIPVLRSTAAAGRLRSGRRAQVAAARRGEGIAWTAHVAGGFRGGPHRRQCPRPVSRFGVLGVDEPAGQLSF